MRSVFTFCTTNTKEFSSSIICTIWYRRCCVVVAVNVPLVHYTRNMTSVFSFLTWFLLSTILNNLCSSCINFQWLCNDFGMVFSKIVHHLSYRYRFVVKPREPCFWATVRCSKLKSSFDWYALFRFNCLCCFWLSLGIDIGYISETF